LGDGTRVKSIVFQQGVGAFGDEALGDFQALESVVFPAGCPILGLLRVREISVRLDSERAQVVAAVDRRVRLR
jgi:hypothetical protein